MNQKKLHQIRSKIIANSRTHWSSGPKPVNSEVHILTDAEVSFLKNCRLLAGEGGPANYHEVK